MTVAFGVYCPKAGRETIIPAELKRSDAMVRKVDYIGYFRDASTVLAPIRSGLVSTACANSALALAASPSPR